MKEGYTLADIDLGIELLKGIAIITMTIDHLGAILYPQVEILRIIGRVSFPLFSYLLVLGAENTNNIKRYFIRLITFAFISQIPFVLALSYEPTALNIFFTLATGLLMLVWPTMMIIPIFLFSIVDLSLIVDLDYGTYGLVLIACLYLLRRNRGLGILAILLLHIVIVSGTQIFALAALPLILLYEMGQLKFVQVIQGGNGYPAWRKYAFYFYYPIHLSALYLIKTGF